MIAKKLTRILLVLAILVSGCTLDVGPARYNAYDPGPHYRITTYWDGPYGWHDVRYRYADDYYIGHDFIEIYYDGFQEVWYGGFVIDPWYADWYY